MRAHAVFVTVFLIFHHVVAILHGGVHTEIPVILTSFQNLFVTIVMMLLPIMAVTLTWTRYSKIGLLLLAICMFSSLLFDIYYHYILVSPDNIAHLPIAPANVIYLDSTYISSFTIIWLCSIFIFVAKTNSKNA